jgi:MFS family permease
LFAGVRSRIASVAAVAPRTYWYVWWGTLINRLGNFVVPMLTIYLIKVRGVSVAEAGGVVAMYGAGSIGASFIGGYLTDHVGRKPTLVIALFGGAAAMLGLSIVRDLTAITVMVTVLSLVTEQFRPAVQAIVADVVPRSHLVQAYGLLHWVINIGFAFAIIVGGLLAELDFSILFIADAVTSAAFGVVVLLRVPETRPAAIARSHAEPSRAWFTDGPFVAFVAITFFVALLPQQAVAPLAAYMTEQGFSAAAFGGVIAVNGIFVILLQPILAAWTARHDATRVLVGAALLYGTGIAMHGLAASAAFHAAAVGVWTLGEILESPTRAAIVAAMSPVDARGRYQGAIVLTFGASQLIGPKLGTWTLQHAGPAALWSSCFGLGILVALAIVASGPSRRRRMSR